MEYILNVQANYTGIKNTSARPTVKKCPWRPLTAHWAPELHGAPQKSRIRNTLGRRSSPFLREQPGNLYKSRPIAGESSRSAAWRSATQGPTSAVVRRFRGSVLTRWRRKECRPKPDERARKAICGREAPRSRPRGAWCSPPPGCPRRASCPRG